MLLLFASAWLAVFGYLMWEGQGIRDILVWPWIWERVSNFDLPRNIWHALRLLDVR